MCRHPSGLKELSMQGLLNCLERGTHARYYQIGEWPFLLIRCGCPESADIDPTVSGYESLTPEQARAWARGEPDVRA